MFKVFVVFFSLAVVAASFASEMNHKKEIEQALHTIKTSHNIPALAVAIIENGKEVFVGGYGVDNNGSPITKNSLFRVASITKLFTAQARMQLIEQGKIALNDPVNKYLTLTPDDITIIDLLTHTSGLKDVIKPVDDYRIFETYLNDSMAKNKEGKNQDFKYADLNFNLLGKVIEVASGIKYFDYIQQNILNKTDMRQSGFNYKGSRVKADVSGNYNYGLVINSPIRPYESNYAPSEGLITSVSDLSIWVQHVLSQDNKLLNKTSYQDMLTPRAKTSWGDIKIGLAWQLYQLDDEPVAQHAGSMTGFKSLLMTLPEKKRAIIILGNAENLPRWQIAKVINNILDNKEYALPTSKQQRYKVYIITFGVLLFFIIFVFIRVFRTKK